MFWLLCLMVLFILPFLKQESCRKKKERESKEERKGWQRKDGRGRMGVIRDDRREGENHVRKKILFIFVTS